jgi:hypothetical protein
VRFSRGFRLVPEDAERMDDPRASHDLLFPLLDDFGGAPEEVGTLGVELANQNGLLEEAFAFGEEGRARSERR